VTSSAAAGIPELLASRLLPEQVEQDTAWRAALLPGGSIAPQHAGEFFKQVESQVRRCGPVSASLWFCCGAVMAQQMHRLPAALLWTPGAV
jgi:hypothetical protein